jgi:hypothetical protein
MPSIQQLSNFAQTSLGAYAAELLAGADNSAAYADPAVGMSPAQANAFDATYAVLEQSAPSTDGFSAVLLQNRRTGQKVLAIAGTDPGSLGDLITDFDIGLVGTVGNMEQYRSLEMFHAHLVSAGLIGISEQIVLSGHSLGGFLAQAFTARHPEAVSAAYTYNAPGFSVLDELPRFLGLVDTSAAARITNIHATDGRSFVAGYGTLLGEDVGVRIEADATNPLRAPVPLRARRRPSPAVR